MFAHPAHHPHHAVRRAYLFLGLALAAAMALTSGCAHAPCPLGQVPVAGYRDGGIRMCRPGPTADELEIQRIFAASDAPTRVDPARQAEAERAIREADAADASWAVRFRGCKHVVSADNAGNTFSICAEEAPPPVELGSARTRDLQPIPVFGPAPAQRVATTGKRRHHK